MAVVAPSWTPRRDHVRDVQCSSDGAGDLPMVVRTLPGGFRHGLGTRVPSPEFDCAAPQPARRPKLREVIVSDCTKLGPADTTPRRAAK